MARYKYAPCCALQASHIDTLQLHLKLLLVKLMCGVVGDAEKKVDVGADAGADGCSYGGRGIITRDSYSHGNGNGDGGTPIGAQGNSRSYGVGDDPLCL